MHNTYIRVISLIIIYSFQIFGQDLLHKANEYYQNNKFNRAIKIYYQALEKGENPALVYFNLANTYYQLDSIAKAIVCYQTSIYEAPEFFRAYLNLGILYYNLDDIAGTAAILEQAYALEPDNTHAMLILACAYKNLNEYSVAVTLLEKVLEKDPKMDECYFLLYEINHQIGDLIEAKMWLERYPEDSKRTADKYQLLGELAEETGNLTEAAFHYNHLISIVPEQKWAHYQLVKVMYSNGNVLTALQQAEWALERFKDFGDLALLAGNISFETKFYRKAEKFFTHAYKIGNAGGLVGLQNLLRLYKIQGDNENAAHINEIIVSAG